MAILDCLQGIEVTVWADGEALEEYGTENDIVTHADPAAAAHQQARTVTKYIESVTGTIFWVKVNVNAPFKSDCPNLSFQLFVDGKRIRCLLMSESEYAQGSWSTVFEGPVEGRKSHAKVMAMKFAEIQSTDNRIDSRELKQHEKETAEVGKIEMLVYRRSKGKIIPHSDGKFRGVNTSKVYHDKVLAKDGKSHGVVLGDGKSIRLGRTLHTEFIDGKDFPIAIFRCKYRSAHALQTLHVLPPEEDQIDTEGSSSDSDLDDDLTDLTPKQRNQVMKLLARAKGYNKLKNIKSETKSEIDSAPTIKRDHSDDERDIKPSKKAKFSKKKKMLGKTTIDLTEIDDEEAETQVINLD
ncbi:hypothetical protein ONS96_010080 [Cadophora gregata f. sp. sojae]|nr:hypothetical protein ONS96_010080 [Cadophora gregata f. sp. sojae]